jgi:flagellar basal body-associated protein FliL
MVIFIGVAIILIVGAIAGYMFIKKKKETTDDQIIKTEDISQNRPSFTSSVGSMMDE